MEIEKKINLIHVILKLIKELPDPYLWANQFRESYKKFKKGGELGDIANACSELSDALYQLERNRSFFLYGILPNKTLNQLTDEELQNVDTLNKIEREVDKFMAEYQKVVDVFSSVERLAYKKLGDVIVELGKELDKRNELLESLSSIIKNRKHPDEIREIGTIYLNLISTIQPLREVIRSFVDEYNSAC